MPVNAAGETGVVISFSWDRNDTSYSFVVEFVTPVAVKRDTRRADAETRRCGADLYGN